MSRHTILVVEGEPSINELWARTLTDAGYRVLRAADAVEATRILVDTQPAVAICDVHLPGASCLRLVELIREQFPKTAIVLAIADGAPAPPQALRASIVTYLLKPVMRHELLAAVEASVAWAERERWHS
jgi:DNA-binding response OmpR family regulator